MLCVTQHRHFLDSSLVPVGIGCLSTETLLANPSGEGPSCGDPSPVAPHQVGCTLPELAASLPLLVRVSLWPPIMFPFALIFFFFFLIPPGSTALPPRLLVPLDCSRNTCVGSFPARGRRLLCPPGERGGRRAGKSTWIGERKKEYCKCGTGSPGSWLDWVFGTEPRAIPACFSLGLGVANPNFFIALYVASCFGEGTRLFQC